MGRFTRLVLAGRVPWTTLAPLLRQAHVRTSSVVVIKQTCATRETDGESEFEYCESSVLVCVCVLCVCCVVLCVGGGAGCWRQVCLEQPDGEDSLFIKIMLAAVEYECFIQMMREVAQEEAGLRK